MCFPDPFPAEVGLALERAGYPWKAIDRAEHAQSDEPEDGWSGAVVCADVDAAGAFALCRLVRTREVPLRPLLLVVASHQIGDLQLREDHFDDFCVLPATPDEIGRASPISSGGRDAASRRS